MNFIMFFERGLDQLALELSLYKDEKDMWIIKEGVSNSSGNLAAHLVGNLNHFIGKTLGDTNYVRDRDKEFSVKDVPQEQLINDIRQTSVMIKNTLSKLSAEDLKKEFPLTLKNETFSIENMLIHLIGHLNYHLGQINYLRRMS